MLAHQFAARDAHVRWAGWTFTRTRVGWQAKEIDGPELVSGDTIAEVEARVEQCERIGGLGQPTHSREPTHEDIAE